MGNEQLLKRVSELTGVSISDLEKLEQCNLLDKTNKLRILILHEYYIKMKLNEQSLAKIKLDLVAKYDVPHDFVHNSVYKYRDLYNPFL